MALLAFHIALAQISALPLRREIKKSTLERSVMNLCDCISMNSATCRRKPPTQQRHQHMKLAGPWDIQRQMVDL